MKMLARGRNLRIMLKLSSWNELYLLKKEDDAKRIIVEAIPCDYNKGLKIEDANNVHT